MTSPVTKKDLWLAIFSLDSYQRNWLTRLRREQRLPQAEVRTG